MFGVSRSASSSSLCVSCTVLCLCLIVLRTCRGLVLCLSFSMLKRAHSIPSHLHS
ncbi:hypothetical protein K2173_003622 [Erythroxylum novogranatense]|uniref:Secreted protein n=1 Tax=Erythroxylum novogranatense TaxID=1862640 RepID=A0AAV8TAT4_9ROSI|nr:hypothetical protein K2173_003622 [Erythroxylum novogranatense]